MNEPTLLADLRASGIAPMRPDEIREIAIRCARNQQGIHPAFQPTKISRLVADLLAARGKLAEVREALESDLRELQPTSAAGLLEILDREEP